MNILHLLKVSRSFLFKRRCLIFTLQGHNFIFSNLKRTWRQDTHNGIQPENAIFNISYESARIPLNRNNSKNIMTLQKPICNGAEMPLFLTYFDYKINITSYCIPYKNIYKYDMNLIFFQYYFPRKKIYTSQISIRRIVRYEYDKNKVFIEPSSVKRCFMAETYS